MSGQRYDVGMTLTGIVNMVYAYWVSLKKSLEMIQSLERLN